jgi:hypothetical protein
MGMYPDVRDLIAKRGAVLNAPRTIDRQDSTSIETDPTWIVAVLIVAVAVGIPLLSIGICHLLAHAH